MAHELKAERLQREIRELQREEYHSISNNPKNIKVSK